MPPHWRTKSAQRSVLPGILSTNVQKGRGHAPTGVRGLGARRANCRIVGGTGTARADAIPRGAATHLAGCPNDQARPLLKADGPKVGCPQRPRGRSRSQPAHAHVAKHGCSSYLTPNSRSSKGSLVLELMCCADLLARRPAQVESWPREQCKPLRRGSRFCGGERYTHITWIDLCLLHRLLFAKVSLSSRLSVART